MAAETPPALRPTALPKEIAQAITDHRYARIEDSVATRAALESAILAALSRPAPADEGPVCPRCGAPGRLFTRDGRRWAACESRPGSSCQHEWPAPASPAEPATQDAASSSPVTSGGGDAAENIHDNPRSWAAWKREAERLESALAERTRERDDLLAALMFKPGPVTSVVLGDAAGLRPAMVAARTALASLHADLGLDHWLAHEAVANSGSGLLARVWAKAKAAESRATAAEALANRREQEVFTARDIAAEHVAEESKLRRALSRLLAAVETGYIPLDLRAEARALALPATPPETPGQKKQTSEASLTQREPPDQGPMPTGCDGNGSR